MAAAARAGEGGAQLCLGRRRRRLAGHPGRRRCAPGRAMAARVGAGGGARCTVTGSCAPRPREDIHRPARLGSASARRGAQLCAAQGSRTAPRFAPSYFGGRWETAGGELRVDGGFAPVASSVPSLGNPQKSRRSRRCCGFGAVRRGGWGSGATNPAPPASWNGLSGNEAGEERSGFANLNKKFGSPRLPAGPRRSRTAAAAAAAGDSTAGAGLGGFSRVLFPAGCGCTEVNGEQRLPASQPGGAGMTKPAGRRQPRSSAAGREGKQSLSHGSLQLLDGLMSVSDRLPGAGMSPRTQRLEPRVRAQKSLGDSDGFGPQPSNL